MPLSLLIFYYTMKDEVRTLLSDMLEEQLERVNQVGEVFTDYFGEPLVDVQKVSLAAFTDIYSDRNIYAVAPIESEGEEIVLSNGEKTKSIPKDEWEKMRRLPFYEVVDEELFHICSIGIQSLLTLYLSRYRSSIIVRFPKVTVTNENDASIDITELYARVDIDATGKIVRGLRFYRAEYTVAQYRSNYAHSHLPGVRLDWQEPCLGSGPIRNTQGRLRDVFDLDVWGLYCYELSKYVTVESLAGVPYQRLENVGNAGSSPIPYPYDMNDNAITLNHSSLLTSFIRYYVRTQKFEVAFVNGTYVLGCDPLDFLINLSKCFISWYNRREPFVRNRASLNTLLGDGLLQSYIIDNKTLRFPITRNGYTDLNHLQGRELFRFKDRMVTLNFIDLEETETHNTVILLYHDIACRIISRFLRVLNYKYGHQETDDSQNTTEENSTNKKHLFF